MRYKRSWLAEVERFERCQCGADRSEVGLAQFFAYESRGVWPVEPDAYFTRLWDGKRWWEWTLNEYAARRFTNEWPGWAQLEDDFAGDPAGFHQVKRRCLSEPWRKER